MRQTWSDAIADPLTQTALDQLRIYLTGMEIDSLEDLIDFCEGEQFQNFEDLCSLYLVGFVGAVMLALRRTKENTLTIPAAERVEQFVTGRVRVASVLITDDASAQDRPNDLVVVRRFPTPRIPP